MSRLFINVLLVLSVAAPLPIRGIRAEAQSLAETLQWMDNTYNPHDYSPGHGLWETYSADGKLFVSTRTRFTFDGCKMTFSTSGGWGSWLPEKYRSSSTSRYTFNLSDIDPTSIHTRAYDAQHEGVACDAFPRLRVCDIAEITLETRNQFPLIDREYFTYPKLKGEDHETHTIDKTYEAPIPLDDVKYAARFEKAFRHAVTLCGGRPSAF
jgi:hypothetical protein